MYLSDLNQVNKFTSFVLKMSFYYFLFTFQDFKVVISSNAVKYNCQDQMWWIAMNEQSTINGLKESTGKMYEIGMKEFKILSFNFILQKKLIFRGAKMEQRLRKS